MRKRSARRSRVERLRHVYVIILRKEVLTNEDFREMNAHYQGRRLCLYVGLSVLTPALRFDQHRAGVHPSKKVRKYGKRVFLRNANKSFRRMMPRSEGNESSLGNCAIRVTRCGRID